MGKILQVRVSASTWDEGEVLRRWPSLCKLVWPVPAQGAAGFTPPPRGVLELASALRDGVKFGDWPAPAVERLLPQIERVAQIQDALAEALAVWDARTANSQTEALENALDRAEDEAGRVRP